MLKQAEATFNNQVGIFKRSEELYKNKVRTVSEYENAKAAYEGAKASFEAAKQNVIGSQYGLAQSQASVKEAQDNLAKTTIYSPVDGVVSKLSIELGERVLGTQQFAGTEIMTISDLSKMDVNVDVNENDINRIALGDSSNIEIDAFLGKKFTGVVSEIGSSANVVGTTADQVTNFTVKVRINAASYMALLKKSADNPSPFRPGLTATVDINTNQVKSLSVPIQSVTTREEKKDQNGPPKKDDDKSKPAITQPSKEYVFVLTAGNKLKQVQVTTGIQNDTYIQVLSGLKGGEEVVSAPYAAITKTLSDGLIVEKVDKSKLFNADNNKSN
jgi:HlyD family secretion protein